MFVKKVLTTALFAGLALALQVAAQGQVVTPVENMHQQPAVQQQPGVMYQQPGVVYQQPVYEASPCECGQSDCVGCRGRLLRRGRRSCDRCPNCNAEVCISESKIDKEERSCWKTEQKVICVPKVRFPWQKCDGPLCGQTRTITLLKKHKYECEVCKHEWKILKPELPKTPEESKSSAIPPIVPGIQANQQYNTLPPAAPVVNSLPYESNIRPASTPRIIQGNGGR